MGFVKNIDGIVESVLVVCLECVRIVTLIISKYQLSKGSNYRIFINMLICILAFLICRLLQK